MRVADLHFDERYRALSSRDSRFDGQFIAGVHSTGIYCRPSCPARTPKPANVTFYRTAAAAHEAGLRACKRCQPDAVPGSPDWNVHDDLASRAMRLIEDGVVEREGVSGVATHLGYTARHLTRVLVAELGAGPLALARAHRAQTARTLLVSTDLPISDVAFAAGFASIRQFNDTVREVFERTPGEVRRAGARLKEADSRSSPSVPASPGTTASPITLRLPARAPFDGAGLMRYFAEHAVAGLESVDLEGLTRSVRLPNGSAKVTLSIDPSRAGVLCIARIDSLADVSPLVSRVRRLFDLDADSVAIDSALSSDEALAPSVRMTPGIRIPGTLDAEETLFRTLIGQQISVAAARTVLARFVRNGVFATAAEIAESDEIMLRGPAGRVRSVRKVAEAVASGELTIDVGMPAQELIERLISQPGIGPWTAGYVAMRVLGAPDILLSTDLVVRKGAATLGLPAASSSLAAYSAQWSPWRSYAGLHLWRAARSAAKA